MVFGLELLICDYQMKMMRRLIRSQEVLDGGAFAQKLIGGLLDASLGVFVIEVESHDGLVITWRGGAREGEHDAFWDVVEGAIRLEADGLPL